ncbi:uncharacterized protein CXorf58 homolog [Rhinolophus ferrumequinum]|uniref:uncharacterized protein CXorf58 homolog n=1 Tax=Rhinolophus ferrumequinum TaxID=59479 RepID=UPI00140F6CA7|nr:uncharacterized protein CXorf58 homolog [Rhinolophus ferrumequinum]
MSLATAAPAGSPQPRPRPLQRGGYGAAARRASRGGRTQAPPPRGSAPAPAVARRPESASSVWAAHWGARREAPGAARLWESAFAAVIGRPAAWAGNSVRGGCRAGALGGPPASSKARQAETADLGGLDLPHKRTREDISALTIQRAWVSHLNKTTFRLLKQTICAAEHCVTHEIVKKVSPLEADLVKDPSMKCKVKFRFGGETFPPFIVFKIFLHTEGRGYKYFSGKNMLKPSSKAAVDAYTIMGRKKFHDQIMEDEHLFRKFKITDELDIVTRKDYIQYSKLLDETPASSGGRNNCWRILDLKNIPATMIMYDIVDYAESGVISNRLQKEMKYLSQRPRTEEMRQDQLRIVSEVRHSSSPSICQPLHRPYQQQTQIKHLGRRSKQAQMKVEKMRKAYKMAKEINASVGTEPQEQQVQRNNR